MWHKRASYMHKYWLPAVHDIFISFQFINTDKRDRGTQFLIQQECYRPEIYLIQINNQRVISIFQKLYYISTTWKIHLSLYLSLLIYFCYTIDLFFLLRWKMTMFLGNIPALTWNIPNSLICWRYVHMSTVFLLFRFFQDHWDLTATFFFFSIFLVIWISKQSR